MTIQFTHTGIGDKIVLVSPETEAKMQIIDLVINEYNDLYFVVPYLPQYSNLEGLDFAGEKLSGSLLNPSANENDTKKIHDELLAVIKVPDCTILSLEDTYTSKIPCAIGPNDKGFFDTLSIDGCESDGTFYVEDTNREIEIPDTNGKKRSYNLLAFSGPVDEVSDIAAQTIKSNANETISFVLGKSENSVFGPSLHNLGSISCLRCISESEWINRNKTLKEIMAIDAKRSVQACIEKYIKFDLIKNKQVFDPALSEDLGEGLLSFYTSFSHSEENQLSFVHLLRENKPIEGHSIADILKTEISSKSLQDWLFPIANSDKELGVA